jgi:ABC-2 type transport system ATP-binding protein
MGIAQALVHDASVMLLDEPMAALDPDQRDRFAALLAEVTVDKDAIVSTHDVADIETSYDHVVVLVDGRILFHDSIDRFLHLAATPVDAYRKAMASTLDATGGGS